MTYEEVKADYERLCYLMAVDTSDLEDFCGDVCSTALFWQLLENPSKTTAKKMYIDFIREAFVRGFGRRGETPVLDNHDVYEIYRKYH
ncbi:hypothetical protein VA249_46020 (plasmid) [Vibrio alfacsensis]|uniref:hypothetical protein n=1 Tax=Vibrio alfacsensis TaxID=1074311 RepID=UPI001BEF993B|nr:hypothetical protein [Vibrio alfacsensis]BBM67956.1 hypothetical protein VA249_46020 [Vibrio alfacsensis]